jgi:hypothetical protein
MSSLLEITFTQPESGWIGLRLSGPDATFEGSFSHIYPTLEQLCGGLCDVAAGASARRVTFLLEPAELELRISFIGGDDAELTVDLYSDGRRYPGARSSRVFEFCGPRSAILLPIWRALRNLETCLPASDFERAWREPFPQMAMASLTRIIDAESARASHRSRC